MTIPTNKMGLTLIVSRLIILMNLAQEPLRECNLVRLFCTRRLTVIFSKYSPEQVRVGKPQKGRWLSMNVVEGEWGQRQNYLLQVKTLRMNHTRPTYFNADWLDDCCSQVQGRSILQMPYRGPPSPRGREVGGIGGTWNWQSHSSTIITIPTISEVKASLFHQSRIDINQLTVHNQYQSIDYIDWQTTAFTLSSAIWQFWMEHRRRRDRVYSLLEAYSPQVRLCLVFLGTLAWECIRDSLQIAFRRILRVNNF